MCDDEKFVQPEDKVLEKKLPFSPHFLTPAGMLLPKHQQPPPMYGPRGATVPPKFIPKYNTGAKIKKYNGPKKPTVPQKAPQPRNWECWCDACDRDFSSKEWLEVHLKEHVVCGIDGCKFNGHKAVMEKHKLQQHDSGLYEKLKNLQTPEDITKWREERKKNYPTQANIELKRVVREAKKERGEKLEANKSKFNRKLSKPRTKREKKNQRAQLKKEDRSQKKLLQREMSKMAKFHKKKRQIPMFKGTKKLWEDDPPEDNPLLKLIGDYSNSEDDSDDDTDEDDGAGPSGAVDVPNDKITDAPPEGDEVVNPNLLSEAKGVKQQDEMECSSQDAINQQGDMTVVVVSPENAPHEDPQAEASPAKDAKMPTSEDQRKRKLKDTVEQNAPKERKVIKSGLNYGALNNKTRPNTLLFKLLQGEIRHERNVLLQAVKFVIENDFFDEKKKE